MALAPRPYQRDAIDTTLRRHAEGVTRQLGVAATGLGKTVVFANLAAEMGVRTLVLAHRDELVRQAAEKLREVWPGAPSIGIVKGQENDIGCHAIVASVQTLARPKRLARLGPRFGEPDPEIDALFPTHARAPFGLVVVDECHHSSAATYGRILEHVGCGQPGGPLLLGVTATPDRGDGVGLHDIFDEIVWNYDLAWGIRAGYLSDLVGRRVEVDGFHTEAIATSRGDYQAGAAGAAAEAAGVPDATARAIVEYAPGRRTLVFTPTVATAVHTCERLRAYGVEAAWVSGETDSSERRSILRAFAAGTITAVANCDVLTEGYDNPAVDCVTIARPTRSRGKYVQMIGRGTRRYPGKDDCLVLDVVGASNDHSLVTVPDLFGLSSKSLRRRAGQGAERITVLVNEHEVDQVRAGKLRAEDVDLFRSMRDAASLAWVDVTLDGGRRRYVLQLGDMGSLVLAQLDRDDERSWGAQLQHKDPAVGNHTLTRGQDMGTAQGVAEDYARTHAPKLRHVDAEAGWRRRPPSPAQRSAAKRMHVDITGLRTAGDVSDAMTRHVEQRKAKRRQKAQPAIKE